LCQRSVSLHPCSLIHNSYLQNKSLLRVFLAERIPGLNIRVEGLHDGIIPAYHCSNALASWAPLFKGEAPPVESRVLVSPCRFCVPATPPSQYQDHPVAPSTNHILQISIKHRHVQDALDAQLPHSRVPTQHLPNLPGSLGPISSSTDFLTALHNLCIQV